MKLVSKDDLNRITQKFCEDVTKGYVGDGINLYTYISLYESDWVKAGIFPDPPFYRFRRFPRWHHKDKTESFHRYMVHVHGSLTTLGDDNLFDSMRNLYKTLNTKERSKADKLTIQIQEFFDSL